MSVLREARRIVERSIDIDSVKAERIVLGLGYTGVMLDNGEAGVCHSLVSETNPDCCDIIDDAGHLTDIPVRNLLDFNDSWDLFKRIIGVATLNALSQQVIKENPDDYPLLRENLINVLDVEAGDVVSMVGMIKPFIAPLQKKAKQLYILERSSPRPEGVYPDTACEELLPQSAVVVITGSAIANGTLDRLLELSYNARKIAVVGPTASMVPDPVFERGVDYFGGVQVKDAELLMTVLSEAGGTPQMKREAVDLVTYTRPF
jgi:uncharacterized protein (DUF4213/DUF364 family)